MIARLGGDEFVALASGIEAEDGQPFVARLRASLVDYNAGAAPFRLSMSVGISVFDPSAPRGIDELLAEADARMYEEKPLEKSRPSEQHRIRLS